MKINPNFYTYADLASREWEKYSEYYINSKTNKSIYERRISEIHAVKHKVKFYLYENLSLMALSSSVDSPLKESFNKSAVRFKDMALKTRETLWMK